jgi:hypothetical protein
MSKSWGGVLFSYFLSWHCMHPSTNTITPHQALLGHIAGIRLYEAELAKDTYHCQSISGSLYIYLLTGFLNWFPTRIILGFVIVFRSQEA